MQQKYKAAKYLRLSYTDEKSVESDSISNQKKLIDDFLKNHPEIEVVSEKIDDGYSGTNFERPSFKEMLSDIKSGKINCVIVKDLSRLGRDYIDTGRYLREIFPAYGVRFIAVNDNIDTIKDRCDDITVSFKNIINDAYSYDISKKTRSALSIKRKNGDYVGACPVYGYVKSAENKNQLVIDDYAADIVCDIFRMKIEGMSALKIADELNNIGVLSPIAYKKQNGFPFPKGGYADKSDAKWSATTIIRMLKDETYIGTLVQGKLTTGNHKITTKTIKPINEWERTEQAHEAIIRRHNFELVQRIMRLDTRTSPQNEEVYIFSGILICGCCGGRMTRKVNTTNGKKRIYYYCRTGKKNGCNTPVMLKESDLTDCVLQSAKAYINNIISFDELLSKMSVENINSNLIKKYNAQINANQTRFDEIQNFKSGLYESLVNGNIEKDSYKYMRDKYDQDGKKLTAAIDSLKSELENVMNNAGQRLKWIEHFKKYSDLKELDRKVVIQLIRSIRVIDKITLDITFNFEDEYGMAVTFYPNLVEGRVN